MTNRLPVREFDGSSGGRVVTRGVAIASGWISGVNGRSMFVVTGGQYFIWSQLELFLDSHKGSCVILLSTREVRAIKAGRYRIWQDLTDGY